jgi:hypothetical protein
MPRAGFEPAIPATKRPQTYLHRAANGFGGPLAIFVGVQFPGLSRGTTKFHSASPLQKTALRTRDATQNSFAAEEELLCRGLAAI